MVPQSTYVWTTVTPSFLSEHAFDVANMSATLDRRAETKVWGLDPSTIMGYEPVGTPSSSDLGWVSDFKRYAVRIQKDFINNGRSYVNLTRLQCLEHYTGFERDISDVLLVATNDLLDNSTNLLEADNSILAIAMQLNLFVGSTTRQNLWECGTSNSFNCYKRRSWLEMQARWRIGTPGVTKSTIALPSLSPSETSVTYGSTDEAQSSALQT
ncbi:hypothetical protein LTR17_009557 [Elasticomyces elasticus]|nr:hypothetical protein LTR17_009557 [Elasticomyces elasticus]